MEVAAILNHTLFQVPLGPGSDCFPGCVAKGVKELNGVVLGLNLCVPGS